MGEMQAGGLDQAALRANALEEHDELELEEHDGVDRRPAALRIAVRDPLPDKGEVQCRIEVPVEVMGGDELLERDGDGLVQRTEFGRPQHLSPPRAWYARQCTVASRRSGHPMATRYTNG